MYLITELLGWLGFKKTSKAYWLKIDTTVPKCTYYFGPFDSLWEARLMQPGYIEDLTEEQAQGIKVKLLKRMQPAELTIYDEE
ncbi:DUF1816 domain-containing protein [Myxosarcina sp. GI1]|uniref:DUF1816 domain-containing protein n=1 Tax=Myxosarcina sp. GI1 TaxID=1541065 RepID=UPI00056CBF6C|nr:DUF1816 domain-containing protein [Myxosarcina sp. GI1]